MREYARITGFAELPPRWAFGYMQSHRTLAGPDEITWVARTFREKKLPCDALIYLGTEFTPSGWNTRNGEFGWKAENFPDPKRMHRRAARAALQGGAAHRHRGPAHERRRWPMRARPTRRCRAAARRTISGRTIGAVPCYWPYHKPLYDLGVDGMWPDQGDGLDQPSRLARIRMYWEGPQRYRPNERPFALHRNGSPGMQRYGAFLWSGDVYSFWETLKTHVPVAVNTGLSGHSVLGHRHRRLRADGGLHRRAARALVPVRHVLSVVPRARPQLAPAAAVGLEHRRVRRVGAARLHRRRRGSRSEGAAQRAGRADREEVPRAALSAAAVHLHDRARVHRHRPADDARAVAAPSRRSDRPSRAATSSCGAATSSSRRSSRRARPVVGCICRADSGSTSGPNARLDGGREIDRAVDLETMPLHVRAGAIIPMGPVKQYVDEPVDGPLTVTVYPGADGAFAMYDDDGRTFEYRTRRVDEAGDDVDGRDAAVHGRARAGLADAASRQPGDRCADRWPDGNASRRVCREAVRCQTGVSRSHRCCRPGATSSR